MRYLQLLGNVLMFLGGMFFFIDVAVNAGQFNSAIPSLLALLFGLTGAALMGIVRWARKANS